MSRCDHFASMDLQEGLTVGSVVSSGDSGVGPGVGSGVGSAEGSAGGEGFVQLMKIKRESQMHCVASNTGNFYGSYRHCNSSSLDVRWCRRVRSHRILIANAYGRLMRLEMLNGRDCHVRAVAVPEGREEEAEASEQGRDPGDFAATEAPPS